MRKMSDAAIKILKERYFLKNDKGEIIEDWDGLCTRVSKYISSIEEDMKLWENEFHYVLFNRLFLPNTPTLMNAGKQNMGSLHACFVYPIEDSMGSSDSIDSITDSWKAAALIGKEGGGIGYSFSNLRPKGDLISTSKGEASGPVSFMKVNDAVAEAVKQGGTRRIAQMGILNCLRGDTNISTLNGKVKIKDLVGQRPYLYCIDDENKIRVRQAKKVFSNGVRELIRIWFDDDTYLDCTKDHKIRLFNGNFIKASDLKFGDRLSIFYKYLCNGYLYVAAAGQERNSGIPEHWAVGEMKYGTYPEQKGAKRDKEDTTLHHIDFNQINNMPENLEMLTWTEHAKKHIDNLELHRQRIAKDRKGKTLEETYGQEKAYIWRQNMSITRRGRIPWNKGITGKLKNHKVIKLESLNIKEEVFDIEMPDFHNFVANNVFVHNCHHPDILEFIKCKNEEGQIKNFNISVAITDKFMEAVRKNKEYELINPSTKKVVAKIPAKEIWDEIVAGAWINGEPGVVFIDTINKYHNLKKRGEIQSTNPCSEQPLLPMEACVLGSIDVGKLIDDDKQFNWKELDHIVQIGTRFLDNTVTLSKAPIKEINETVSNNRKIGLGIMGFADCLIQLGITYGSEESFKFAERLAKRIKEVSHETSVELGKQKGLPLNSKFYENTTPGTPDLKGIPRNACQISYAPTGTIASIADASFGIEPLYDVCFIKNILDGKRIFFVSDIVAKHLKELGYEKAVKEIESGKSLEEIDIPKNIKNLFATAMSLKPEQHVKMQAAFQKYCDSAISKTCNLPNKATREDVSEIYFMAYDLGCKGITVYRDGSRQFQVVEVGKGKKEQKIVKRPDVVQGLTYKIPTSFGKLYVTINKDGDIPIEVFFSMADISNDMSSLLSALGRTLSVSLKHGTPLKDIIKTLKKVKVGTVVYYNGKMFKSVPQLVAGVLEEVFIGKESPAVLVSLCDKCGSQLLQQEGCEKCSNPECGYTKCG